MIRPIVEQFVAQAVATSDVNSELKHSFKSHERYTKLIDHLVDEANKLPPKYSQRDILQDVCTGFTHAFLQLVEKKSQESAMSHAAKQAMLDKQAKREKQEQIVDDMNDGKEIDAERIVEVAK